MVARNPQRGLWSRPRGECQTRPQRARYIIKKKKSEQSWLKEIFLANKFAIFWLKEFGLYIIKKRKSEQSWLKELFLAKKYAFFWLKEFSAAKVARWLKKFKSHRTMLYEV